MGRYPLNKKLSLLETRDPGDPGLALPQPHLALPLLLPHLLVSLPVEAQLLQLVSPPQPGSHSESGQEDQPHRQEDGPEALQVPAGMAGCDVGVELGRQASLLSAAVHLNK